MKTRLQGDQSSSQRRLERGRSFAVSLAIVGLMLTASSPARGDHQGHATTPDERLPHTVSPGYPVSGAPFRVFAVREEHTTPEAAPATAELDNAARTVADALTLMMHRRRDYPRFDQAVKHHLLEQVVVEATVRNHEGKEFAFLVARTAEPGLVKLLVSASALEREGYVNHPDKLVPTLAKEFQWVVSKADTSPKPKTVSGDRDISHAPVRSDAEIGALTPDDRLTLLKRLLETYLTTVDDQHSLIDQAYYEVGTRTLVPPAQADSTMKLYDIRVREALAKIVRDPYFIERTPKAVKSLLNGKVWNVCVVKVDQRDWATRTRVASEDQAVMVGPAGLRVQPAKILINLHRTAAPDDPFYAVTNGLPMGALTADQLARVIAWEIERNIVEKSMTGHVAQDAMSAPK